jgi:S-adenosylmethionine synthetase
MQHVTLLKQVAAGVADEILVQVSYAIGVANQWEFYRNLRNIKVNLTDGEIAKKVAIF